MSTPTCFGNLLRTLRKRVGMTQGDLAAALATAFNYQEMLGHLQGFLGLATLYQGQIAEARQILQANHRHCTDLKDKGLLSRNTVYLAATYLWEGLLDEAEQWLNRSYAHYANPHRVRIDVVERLSLAACLAAGQQQYGRAATIFGLAEQIRSRLDYALPEPLRRMVDAALATARAVLDPTVFAEAFAAGQQMALAEAFAGVLAPAALAAVGLEKVQFDEPVV